MKYPDQYTKMTASPIPKLILTLAVPTILSMLITSIYNMADAFFVGQISTSASGAVGIVASLMSIIQALGFTFGHGAGSTISRLLGQKDQDAASRFASTSFFSALGLGTVLGMVGLAFLPNLMLTFGSTETILPHACDYARYILCAMPIMMSSLVMNNILRYEGKASFAMIGLVTGGLLNILLDPILIFGLKMGTGGAGCATAISQTVGFLILLSMFLRGKTISRLSIRQYTRNPKDLQTIIKMGFPSFGRQGLASVSGMLLNIAASAYGDAAVAGMSIISRIFMFIYSVAIGTGQGFQPVSGFNFGAKKYRRLRFAALFTMGVIFLSMAALGLLCLSFSEPLIRLFRDDPAVTAVALPAFRIQSVSLVLQPVIVVGNMLFQSIGKAGRATLLACCRQGLCFIPLILTLPHVLGLTGIMICQPIADVLTFCITLPILLPYLNFLKHAEE